MIKNKGEAHADFPNDYMVHAMYHMSHVYQTERVPPAPRRV